MATDDEVVPTLPQGGDITRPIAIPPTPTGAGVASYSHLHDRIERLHTDNKQTLQRVNAHELRIGKLEFVDEQTDKRLRDGAATFEEMRKQIMRPWWQTLLLAAPGILVLIGWAFTAGSMPSRAQFDATRDDVRALQVQQARFEVGVTNLQKSADEIARKLDDLSARPASRQLP